MPIITLTKPTDYEVQYLKVECSPRYWEDATVNGQEDTEGNMPFRKGDSLTFTILLKSGQIIDWPAGTTATMNYKVCDAGVYTLLSVRRNIVLEREGYVPGDLCIGENGYGDYLGLEINEEGFIKDWNFNADDWEEWHENEMENC